MHWRDYDTSNCSIARTLEVIGEKWTILVIREAFNGVRRFDEIREHVGLSESILADRLRKLLAHGVLSATIYRKPGQRARREYRLTEKGLDLYPVMIALLGWGDAHLADAAGPALDVRHHDCGERVRAVVACEGGHILSSARESRAHPGPGARMRA